MTMSLTAFNLLVCYTRAKLTYVVMMFRQMRFCQHQEGDGEGPREELCEMDAAAPHP